MVCAWCGKKEMRYRSKVSTYCSNACRRIANSPFLQEHPELLDMTKRLKKCVNCDKEFLVKKLHVMRKVRYCSKECLNQYLSRVMSVWDCSVAPNF